MKRKLSIAIATVVLALSAPTLQAEEIEAYFFVATLTSGATEEAMLTNDSTVAAPMLYHKQGQMLINGHLYDTSEIAGIRIEKRTVDAIAELRKPADNGMTTVYDLQGRKIPVPSTSSLSSVLPKGIYIIGGRKVVVK